MICHDISPCPRLRCWGFFALAGRLDFPLFFIAFFHWSCHGCRGQWTEHGLSDLQKWSGQYLHFGISVLLCIDDDVVFSLEILWSMFDILSNNMHIMVFCSFLVFLHCDICIFRIPGAIFIAYGPRAWKRRVELTKEHYWSRSSGNVCSQIRQNSCSSPLSVTLTSTLPQERHIFWFMKNPP